MRKFQIRISKFKPLVQNHIITHIHTRQHRIILNSGKGKISHQISDHNTK